MENTSAPVYLLPGSQENLATFCQWIVNTQQVRIQQLCLTPRNQTRSEFVSHNTERSSVRHRYNSLYGDAIEHSFATGSGVIGTLGCVLLILVIIAIISCVKEHRRIQLLSSSRLPTINLSQLQSSPTSHHQGREDASVEECNESHIDERHDKPPEYITVLEIIKEEESPPTYNEALEKQNVCQ